MKGKRAHPAPINSVQTITPHTSSTQKSEVSIRAPQALPFLESPHTLFRYL